MYMELAIKLGFEGSQLTAFAVNQTGEMVDFPLKELCTRGLPTCAKRSRRRIDTNLADWTAVDGQAYLGAFGFTGTQPSDINHQFFEVKDDKWTYIVPALALMRGLFRPSKDLLPEMFMLQALDRQCRLEVSAQGTSVLVDAAWTRRSRNSRCSDWGPLFDWLMTHTSAFNMAGSVHARAMNGQIGLELPKAEMRIVCRGLNVGRTLYVNEASVVSITPLETPFIEVSGLPSTFILFDRETTQGQPRGLGSLIGQFTVPVHKTNGVAVSDQEWAQIEPIILAANKSNKQFVLPQRELLNGVLEKLATGTPWKQVKYTAGTWSNAFQALRKWTHNGTFVAILDILSERQSAP
jgi:hypothetical protein